MLDPFSICIDYEIAANLIYKNILTQFTDIDSKVSVGALIYHKRELYEIFVYRLYSPDFLIDICYKGKRQTFSIKLLKIKDFITNYFSKK